MTANVRCYSISTWPRNVWLAISPPIQLPRKRRCRSRAFIIIFCVSGLKFDSMSLRKSIFWLHLVAGSIAGLVILVMSVTGVVLAFERQIMAMVDGYRIEQTGWRPERLAMETLLEK